MNDTTLRYLRALQHGPRSMRSFTQGDFSVHANVVQHHMDLLMDAGHAEQIGTGQHTKYAITPLGERYLANRPQTAASRYICNASQSEPYRPAPWLPARSGADYHKRFASFGSGT